MTEQLSPDVAVRLLRVKSKELEDYAKRKLVHAHGPTGGPLPERWEIEVGYLAADIALIAELLAQHIERRP